MWPIWSRDPCYAPLRDSRRSSVTDTVTRSMRHAYYTPLRGGGRSRVANWSRGLCYTPPRGGVRLSVTYVVTQSMILAATRWRQVERDLLIHAATRDGGRSSVTHVVTRSVIHAATRDGGRSNVTDAVTRSRLHAATRWRRIERDRHGHAIYVTRRHTRWRQI